tara:strand:- start:73 stop:204 length:132 start_codon:yes stop_codon:yes gene_type:complete
MKPNRTLMIKNTKGDITDQLKFKSINQNKIQKKQPYKEMMIYG